MKGNPVSNIQKVKYFLHGVLCIVNVEKEFSSVDPSFIDSKEEKIYR